MEDDFKGGRCLLSGDAPSNVSTVENAKFSLHLRLPRCPLQAKLNKMNKYPLTDFNHFSIFAILTIQAIPEPRILTGAGSSRDNRLSPYFDDGGGFRPSSLQSLTVGIDGGGGNDHTGE